MENKEYYQKINAVIDAATQIAGNDSALTGSLLMIAADRIVFLNNMQAHETNKETKT